MTFSKTVYSIVSYFCFAGIFLPTADAQTSGRLVHFEMGDLPIILSAPHGGSDPIPGVPQRQGKGVALFKSRSDAFTDQLTEKLADAIEENVGQRPYVIIARFHRKYVDANRRASDAYESPDAQAVYRAYHRAIADARRDVIERWGQGILFDIHGQAAESLAIFRGTQNGKTTTHLIKQFGRESLSGKTSVFGLLAKQGVPVIPATGSTERENSSYDGGYIVTTYGSGSGGTVDAIQLELGRKLRTPGENLETADKLATAIAEFAKQYLPVSELVPSDSDSVRDMSAAAVTAKVATPSGTVFFDDFSDSDRKGWFELDHGSSTLSVKSKSGQLSSRPELNFATTDIKSVQSCATHFPGVELSKAGDSVALQFDARHNNSGFGNRGFRFGLFSSGGTQFESDDDLGASGLSLDDRGYFVMLDLGSSTTFDSAVIRENNNATDDRLWNGNHIASDAPDNAADPLMFTRNKNFNYSLTLVRNDNGSVDVVLKNHVTGDKDALTGTSKLMPTLKFDTIYFGTYGSTADFAIGNVTVTHNQNVPPGSKAEDVRVGVYVDEGAGPSVKDLLFVLSKIEGVLVTQLKAEDIRSGMLDNLDLLMQPGGSGGGQGRHLGESGRDAIRGFVTDGGGFVGICAGAYLASADYAWSLNILDAKVVDRKHWNRGNGVVDIALTDSGRQLLRTGDQQLAMHYAQGPLLAPANRPDIDDYDIVATFETEIAKNGAPKGVMKGTTAIAKGTFGSGRVVCFSPHPEMTSGLEHMVRLAIDHVKRNREAQSN